jgi:hypothetical protein
MLAAGHKPPEDTRISSVLNMTFMKMGPLVKLSL